MEPTTCHFCDGLHSFDEAGVADCRPKRRYKGAFDAALAAPPSRRVDTLLGRVIFLGERPDRGYVELLLERVESEGWPT